MVLSVNSAQSIGDSRKTESSQSIHLSQGPQFQGKASKRMHVMAKPIGAVCNIDCNYCYYLSKQDLLEYKKRLFSRDGRSASRAVHQKLH